MWEGSRVLEVPEYYFNGENLIFKIIGHLSWKINNVSHEAKLGSLHHTFVCNVQIRCVTAHGFTSHPQSTSFLRFSIIMSQHIISYPESTPVSAGVILRDCHCHSQRLSFALLQKVFRSHYPTLLAMSHVSELYIFYVIIYFPNNSTGFGAIQLINCVNDCRGNTPRAGWNSSLMEKIVYQQETLRLKVYSWLDTLDPLIAVWLII